MGSQAGKVINPTKKAIRIIANAKYNSHTSPIFKENKLLTLEDIHVSNKLKFFYKLENNTIPPYFWTYMFLENKNKTRSKDPYQQLVPKTAIFSESIRFRIPILLHNTPPLIKSKAQTHSYDGFNNYVKNHMIQTYNIECNKTHCYTCKTK